MNLMEVRKKLGSGPEEKDNRYKGERAWKGASEAAWRASGESW